MQLPSFLISSFSRRVDSFERIMNVALASCVIEINQWYGKYVFMKKWPKSTSVLQLTSSSISSLLISSVAEFRVSNSICEGNQQETYV